MNWKQIEGKWPQVKCRARQRWGRLTDSDLDKIDGHRDVLVGKIEERYGTAHDWAEAQVDAWRLSLS